MKSLERLVLPISLYAMLLPMALFALLSLPHKGAMAQDSAQWDGVWFACEFAQRQRAPDEGCQMFDDEGFSYQDGVLHYLRMIGSQETACRGNKTGQCFARNKQAITVTKKPIGELRIEDDRLILRYWGCEQSYRLYEGDDYMTVKPLGKNCFWSQERHFYIARYDGRVTTSGN